MLVRSIKRGGATLSLLDLSTVLVSFFAAFYLKKYVILPHPELDLNLYTSLILLEIPFIMLALYLTGIYSARVMLSDLYTQFRTIGKAMVWVLAVFVVVSFYAKVFSYPPSRVVFTLFFVFLSTGMILSRLTIAAGKKVLNEETGVMNRVLVFGDPDRSKELVQRLGNNIYCRFHLLGVAGAEGMPVSSAIAMIEQGAVDIVIIDLPLDNAETISRVTAKAEEEGVCVYMTPRVFPSTMLNLSRVIVGGIPLITLEPKEIPLRGMIEKRLMDLGISLFLLIALSPLMIAIAAMVKLTSKGPVLFRSRRVGLDGREFEMLKFRTMKVNDEKARPLDYKKEEGAVIMNRSGYEEQCTAIGRLLRRTNLDELPQLINVLGGSMSIVGPRPERTGYVKLFKQEIHRYTHKHWVKPGMTGWAQVNGWRGDTDIKERIRHDIFYIENWSLWMDIKILFMTLFMGHKNAM